MALVQLKTDMPALLFSAASSGVSGWMIHYAVLRPGTGKDLENLLLSDAAVSNQSQTAFWSDPSISDARLFITANYVWEPDEGHFGPHRYIISAFVMRRSAYSSGFCYSLEDLYMTARAYALDAGEDILASEQPEILKRLLGLKLKDDSRRLPQ